MEDIQREIHSIIKRNQEIDYRVNKLKQTVAFQKWFEKPIYSGKNTESKTFKVTLWKNTPKQEVINQKITKGIEKRLNTPIKW